MSENIFPIIGIGASAGGLEALKEFFSAVPADCDQTFVIVTHHNPKGTSLLPEILSRETAMPVEEVTNGTVVKSGHVYLSPPSHYLSLRKGMLVFDKPITDKIPLPVDFFFRSLAAAQEENAICILLSGTGSDGTLGLLAIKGECGMAIAQEPKTAQFSDMPENAIATGRVDFVLAPQDMPKQLSRYTSGLVKDTSEDTAKHTGDMLQSKDLDDILGLVCQHTGSNFGLYKTSTMKRRIERRMHIHQISEPALYVQNLKKNTHEINGLFKELLIGVTAFFRDPEAFAELERLLPDLLKNKAHGDTVRVWSAGCSTGEEAYSLAILLHEYMERKNKHLNLQVFATDLDENAINHARAGLYAEGIALDVSAERLEKYFQKEGSHFRIKRNIRTTVTFATQNLAQDPPFTKLDLVVCRNLLIYLDSKTQKRLIPLFHYTLRPGGILFLGSSEAIGSFSNLFVPLHGRSKIFQSKDAQHARMRFSKIMDMSSVVDSSYKMEDRVNMPQEKETDITAMAQNLLLSEHIPPSLIVNEKGDIFFVHGRTGLYLELMPGQPHPHQNVLDMAREGLQLPLTTVLRKAAKQDTEIIKRGVIVRSNGHVGTITLRARKIKEPEALHGLIWIMFEKESDDDSKKSADDPEIVDMEADQMERELRLVKKSLQGAIEEREMANEQLKSSNEELQSTNEEMQSANEELETAKEEMQSLNEELQTVNAELERKISDLSHSNDDMKNLLDGTGIATIFLDKKLNLKRFTTPTKKILRLIPSDVGRPISDISTHLEYNDLVRDATAVLNTLKPKEFDVRAEDWHWYLARILPYQTTENVVDGLAVTFVDITKMKKSEILLATNVKALEMISLEQDPLSVILDEVLHRIESQTKGIKCAIYILNKEGTALEHSAGPSLPEAFNKQMGKIKIEDDTAQPCAMAVQQNKPVIMSDLTEQSPTPLIKLALKRGIKAVWAQPINSSEGKTMGVFAVYYDQPHEVYPMEEELINEIVPLMSTILSRHLLKT